MAFFISSLFMMGNQAMNIIIEYENRNYTTKKIYRCLYLERFSTKKRDELLQADMSVDNLDISLDIYSNFISVSVILVNLVQLIFVLILILLTLLLLQLTDPGFNSALLLQNAPFLKEWKCNPHKGLISQKIVYKLIHIYYRQLSRHAPYSKFSVVDEKWLEGLVSLGPFGNQPQIEQSNGIQVFIIPGFQVFQGYLFGEVHLQQLENETQKLGGFFGAAIESTDICDLDCFVNECFGVQCKALFLPVATIKNMMPGQFVDNLHTFVVRHVQFISYKAEYYYYNQSQRLAMGTNNTKPDPRSANLQNIVLKKCSGSYHNLHSPRDHHKQYVWKKWKYNCQKLADRKLASLNKKLSALQDQVTRVLQVDYMVINKHVYEVKAKVQYSDRNLKTEIQKRIQTNTDYTLAEIWDMVVRICQIVKYLHQSHSRVPQDLSSYVIVSQKIKAKDLQLLPDIQSKRSQPQLADCAKNISRIIANIGLLSYQTNQVTLMEITRINLKYNVALATFIYSIRDKNLNPAQILDLAAKLRQQNHESFLTRKIPSNQQLLKRVIKTQKAACNQSYYQLAERKENIMSCGNVNQSKIQYNKMLNNKFLNKSVSDQKFTRKNSRRIQQIKPKQIKRSQFTNHSTFQQENKQNSQNTYPNQHLSPKNKIDIEDHNFPKKVKQFRKTSTTISDDCNSSRNMDMRNSQARNEAFMKLTGGEKCELFGEDDNDQSLLQSIIQSEESIIIRGGQSPVLNLDQEIESIAEDFLKLQTAFNQAEKYQHKSIIQFGYQRNSTIMELTQENQQSGGYTEKKQEFVESGQNNISNFSIQIQKQHEKFVIEEYEGGSRYEGYIVNKLRNGFGKLYYQDGGSYEGSWKNGEIEGYGKLYYQSGYLAYQGNWVNGEFHGEGKIINEAPEKIDDNFNYWDLSDIGTCWIWYQGTFQHDHKHGNGILLLSNGQKFTGNWNKNNVEGEGVYITKQGKIINGRWNNNILIQVKQ